MVCDHFHGKLPHGGSYATQCEGDPFEGDGVLCLGYKETLECKSLEITELRYKLCGGFERRG